MPNDSQPEIVVVNSQTLQDEVNAKLPSQRGFGSELMASNVITPIIDLTEATGGGAVATDLLRALAFGSQTAFSVDSTTVTIANTVGFFRVFGVVNCFTTSSSSSATFTLDDGVTTKTILKFQAGVDIPSFDFIVFLAAGESLKGVSTDANYIIDGSVRQIADGSGTTVNPNGYPV